MLISWAGGPIRLMLSTSEGHQDSMGVCLFLALNEELAKGDLGLIRLGRCNDVC